ncbi:hypothetical protein DCC81_12070 [Chitinophaga parva]|uniref:Uncharacterized protein n=1 Tax=Chitinophaga parva TaxID=2169414 RepID=A0A2T7BFP4_9BACT|nr:hypothetical protein [Chitinophaga parva]PUZ25043.1 hypothetical protein DCC81_12070 [Chitinophaga parva]
MDQATLEARYRSLVHQATEVRKYQKRYFQHRASSDLEKARYHERQLDKLLAKQNEEQISPQQQLF